MSTNFYINLPQNVAMPVAKHSSFKEATNEARRLVKQIGQPVYTLHPIAVASPKDLATDFRFHPDTKYTFNLE